MRTRCLLMLAATTCLVSVGCYSPTASVNANLSAITLSAGTLSPAFDAETTTYYVSVEKTVTSITISGTSADSNATVSTAVTLDGLAVGRQTATITVKAQSGTTKEYTVTVDRTGDYTATAVSGLTLKCVPAGSFQRDGTAANISTISQAFRMGATEVTRAQFTAVCGTKVSDPSSNTYSCGTSGPVQKVCWYHTLVFCNLLSITEGLTPVYTIRGSTDPNEWDGDSDSATITVPTTNDSTWAAVTADWSANGYRLPTEMEWMWAAMGATSDAISSDMVNGVNTGGYNKAFSGSTGSNSIGDYAWYDSNTSSEFYSHTVGTKTANELGIYDMSGNVYELCWDGYDESYDCGDYLVTGAVTDYRGDGATSGDVERIIRGGGFYQPSDYVTVGFRFYINAVWYWKDIGIGFRVVRN